jgi:hypothetical protein
MKTSLIRRHTTMKTSLNLTSPFEPGATTAPASPPAAAAPLESAPGTDHFAAVEAKRIEMIHEWGAKVDALKERAADLRQQAKTKHAERYKLGVGDYNRIMTLQAEAESLEGEARRLLNIDLPQLEAERMAIGNNCHPKLVRMRFSAEGRTQADLIAKRNRSAPEKLPGYVVLDEQFGWTENSIPTVFAKGQVVRDPALISKLIELKAPLAR